MTVMIIFIMVDKLSIRYIKEINMTVLRYLSTLIIAILFTFSAQAEEIKENSSDRRLMTNIVEMEVLDNGMVIYDWVWNDAARRLDPKYGMPVEEGGYPSQGLIAQDVQAKYPDAVIKDNNGYLIIDIPVLAENDELIAQMVMEGGADVVSWKKVSRKFSDIHLKQNIQKIGVHKNGLGIYVWKWNEEARRKGINDLNIGFIAQEAQVLHPQHVSIDPSGYLMLDYDLLNR